MLTPNKVNSIMYTNGKGETKEKDVIVFAEPSDNVLTIEVTNESGEYVEKIIDYIKDYNEYLALRQATQVKFEDFITQTANDSETTIKWRALNRNNISLSE